MNTGAVPAGAGGGAASAGGSTATLRDAARRLAIAGVPSPRVDAELLLAHVLGVSRGRLPVMAAPDADAAARFAALLERRADREPLQHLIGTAPFRYLSVAVGPGVFVPRPETELLVDAVLPALRCRPAPWVVDLCAGSGALALSVAHEVPAARVIALEQPGEAATWLRRNTAGTTVETVVADVRAIDAGAERRDVDAPLAAERGRVDAVLCNPPYVPAGSAVAAEVGHDPATAVFAGTDGLALMPAVLSAAAALLRPGGVLALEHDDSHGHAVPALLRATGRFIDIVDHRDLTGRPRYVTAVRSSGTARASGPSEAAPGPA